MPRLLTRPTKDAVDQIETCLLESDLTSRARRQLRAVLSWARGKTPADVASDHALKMSEFTVRKAIHCYIAEGLAGFKAPVDRSPGRQKIDPEITKSVVRDFAQSLAAGAPLPYRELATRHGISLGKVAAIAKDHKFDARNRRGPMKPHDINSEA